MDVVSTWSLAGVFAAGIVVGIVIGLAIMGSLSAGAYERGRASGYEQARLSAWPSKCADDATSVPPSA